MRIFLSALLVLCVRLPHQRVARFPPPPTLYRVVPRLFVLLLLLFHFAIHAYALQVTVPTVDVAHEVHQRAQMSQTVVRPEV
mmetsp:Transcript_13810/g.41612  ORF Transcript_13810/g.41612 Transcript_13810/m.41612 type:complete len:82 (+) Transcript_13810:383-628(+)